MVSEEASVYLEAIHHGVRPGVRVMHDDRDPREPELIHGFIIGLCMSYRPYRENGPGMDEGISGY